MRSRRTAASARPDHELDRGRQARRRLRRRPLRGAGRQPQRHHPRLQQRRLLLQVDGRWADVDRADAGEQRPVEAPTNANANATNSAGRATRSQQRNHRRQPSRDASSSNFGGDQFFPWVTINTKGELNVTFHDRRLDTELAGRQGAWPTSKTEVGNYLVWYWGGTCKITSTVTVSQTGTGPVPAGAQQCVAPEAVVNPTVATGFNPAPGRARATGRTRRRCRSRTSRSRTSPSNFDYTFRAGLFAGDYSGNATGSIDPKLNEQGDDRTRTRRRSLDRCSQRPRLGRSDQLRSRAQPDLRASDVFFDKLNGPDKGKATRSDSVGRHAVPARDDRQARPRRPSLAPGVSNGSREGPPPGGPSHEACRSPGYSHRTAIEKCVPSEQQYESSRGGWGHRGKGNDQMRSPRQGRLIALAIGLDVRGDLRGGRGRRRSGARRSQPARPLRAAGDQAIVDGRRPASRRPSLRPSRWAPRWLAPRHGAAAALAHKVSNPASSHYRLARGRSTTQSRRPRSRSQPSATG